MKLLTLLFLTLSIPVCAQFHNVKGIRVVDRAMLDPADTATISGVGQIQYDGDDDKIRFNDGNGWYSFLKDDATLPYWPLTGTSTITGSTVIQTDGNAVELKVGDSGFAASDSLSITGRAGLGDLEPGPILGVTSDISSFNLYGILGYIDTSLGGEISFLKIGGGIGSPHAWKFYDYRTIKSGIEYENPDTTEWVGGTLTTRDYVRQHVGTQIDEIVPDFWNANEAPTLDPDDGIYNINAVAGTDLVINVDTLLLNDDVELVVGGTSFWRMWTAHVDNSASGTSDVATQSFNIWLTFSATDKVVTSLKVTAVAVEGSTGDDVYASEKIFVVFRDDDGSVSIQGNTTIYQVRTNSTADQDFGVNGSLIELSFTTPANSEYEWKFSAQITQHSI